MKASQFLELLMLAALWGISFMFMRVAAPEFGPFAMAGLRMTIAAVVLSPILYILLKKVIKQADQDQLALPLIQMIRRVIFIGITNSALPAVLFAYAALNLDAGFSSIVNATTPLWGAFIGITLFGMAISRLGIIGLFVGFIGVVLLTSNKLSFNINGEMLAIIAVVSATLLYGFSANYTKRYLAGIPPLLIASGSLLGATMLMLPFVFVFPPNYSAIPISAWSAMLALGTFSTGFAYLLYYRIIDHSGPEKAMTVTFLIPLFGVLFGNLFLNEQLHINMALGGGLILIGVLLTTGVLKRNKTRN